MGAVAPLTLAEIVSNFAEVIRVNMLYKGVPPLLHSEETTAWTMGLLPSK